MSNPPIPFPGAANVPIIGSNICTFNDVMPDVIITCTCDGPYAHRLVRLRNWAAVGFCRACQRGFTISSLHFDKANEQVQIQISPVVRRDAEPGLSDVETGRKPS